MPQTDNRPSEHRGLAALLAACALLAAFAVVWARLQYQTPVVLDSDSAYHLRVAQAMKSDLLLRHFKPWGVFTTLHDRFYDAYYLFHLLLIPFISRADIFAGGKLACVVLPILVLGTLLLVLRRCRVRFLPLWLLLPMTSGVFLTRLDSLRPHLLSVMAVLLFIDALTRGSRPMLAAVSFLYPWAHGSWALLPALATLFLAAQWLYREKASFPFLGWTAGGLAAGLLLHPHVPNNLLDFVAILKTMGMSASGSPVSFGAELFPMTTLAYLQDFWPILLAFLGVLAAYACRAEAKLSRQDFFLLTASLLFGALSLVGSRYVEYAAPVALLFCAGAATRLVERPGTAGPPPDRRWLAGLGALLAAALAWRLAAAFRTVGQDIRDEAGWISAYLPASEWIGRNVPKGEVLFTASWDDTIPLLTGSKDHYYLGLLNPINSILKDAGKYSAWQDYVRGDSGAGVPPSRFISETFPGVRYGFCKREAQSFVERLARDPSIKVLYGDERALVFRLEP